MRDELLQVLNSRNIHYEVDGEEIIINGISVNFEDGLSVNFSEDETFAFQILKNYLIVFYNTDTRDESL